MAFGESTQSPVTLAYSLLGLEENWDFPRSALQALSPSVLLHGPSAFCTRCGGVWVNPMGDAQRMGQFISMSIKQSHSSQLPFRQYNNPIHSQDRSVYNPDVILLPSSKMKHINRYIYICTRKKLGRAIERFFEVKCMYIYLCMHGYGCIEKGIREVSAFIYSSVWQIKELSYACLSF